jgi:catechol 2,3-dioxygenase-like lactoylglutathione lyase family enzyme
VNPVLMCRDVAATLRFFAHLGFVCTYQDRPIEPKYAAIRRDQVELHLQWQDASHWTLSLDRPTYRFQVREVDALFAEFTRAQAIIATDNTVSPWASPADTPWGTREFHVYDPDGNGLQFYRPR